MAFHFNLAVVKTCNHWTSLKKKKRNPCGGKKNGKEESPELKSRAAAALKLFQRQEGEAMLFIDFFAGIVCDGQCDL